MLGLAYPGVADWILQKWEHEREAKLAAATYLPWPQPFKKELFISAESYKPGLVLWDTPAVSRYQYGKPPNMGVLSPHGQYSYTHLVLPKGKSLVTMLGTRRGSVVFDGDITFPALFGCSGLQGPVAQQPWMSLTPMELFTLAPGIKLAKGHVVIAGLGLGYQLLEVAKKPSVTRITLVERSQELVDWILPRIQAQMPNKPLEVIVDNAYGTIEGLTADVALIDIYRQYRGNTFSLPLASKTRIPKVWVWGGHVTYT